MILNLSEQYENNNLTFTPIIPRVFKIQLINAKFVSRGETPGYITFDVGLNSSGEFASSSRFKFYNYGPASTIISVDDSLNTMIAFFSNNTIHNDISIYFKFDQEDKRFVYAYLNGKLATMGDMSFNPQYIYGMLSPMARITIEKGDKIDNIDNIIISEVDAIGD